MEFNTKQRGVVVDARGKYLGIIEWPGGMPPPVINQPRKGETAVRRADVKHLLTDPSAVAAALPSRRWDFKPVRKKVTDPNTGKVRRMTVAQGSWIDATEEATVIDSKGQAIRVVKYFADDKPDAPFGFALVAGRPPTVKHGQPSQWIHDGTGWVQPRRVFIVNDSGIVTNVVCENPRDDAENSPLQDDECRVLASDVGDETTVIGSDLKALGWKVRKSKSGLTISPPKKGKGK